MLVKTQTSYVTLPVEFSLNYLITGGDQGGGREMVSGGGGGGNDKCMHKIGMHILCGRKGGLWSLELKKNASL